ncbi:hypothetical protein [Rhinolophus gammaherpesvirus 1]|uniref:Envelope glycoprotein 150 n=1 Tax=Rhinolophus gammaherpesvirus 1 TaxID=2054179 RepID=A0A2Z5UL45_9GAMA|nr:hypothetical protein [Rhinolophus gammaherpesvirus 1]BBB06477.1 hypothetical protein [Rhinolophus gammaherpesvirus 1]
MPSRRIYGVLGLMIFLILNISTVTCQTTTQVSPETRPKQRPDAVVFFFETIGCSVVALILIILCCVAYTCIKDYYRRTRYGVNAIYRAVEEECRLEARTRALKNKETTIYMPD